MKKTLSVILIVLTVMGMFAIMSANSVEPAKISGLQQSSASQTAVKLKWNAVNDKNVTYDLTLYNSKTTKNFKKISAASKTVSKLAPASTYYVKVRAVTGTVTGSWSNVIKVATCCKGTTAKQTDATANTATLSWTKTEGATGYNIYCKSTTPAGNTYKLLTSTDALKAKVKLNSSNFTSDYLALIVSPVRTATGYSAENKLSSLPDSCVVPYPKTIPTKTATPTYSSGKMHFSANSWVNGFKYAVYELNGKKIKSTTVSVKNKSKATVSYSLKKAEIYKIHACAYIKVNGKILYGEKSSVGCISKAPNVSFKWGDKKLKASWTKFNGATSYSVVFTDTKDKSRSVKISNLTGNTYTVKSSELSGLNVNKSYEIKVKPYKGKTGLQTGKTYTSKIEVIGHRGCMDEAPENTFASYERAYKNGYDSTEADFWETKSGDILISHDNMLSQCGYPELDVRTLTSKTLKDYPIIKGKNINDYPTQYIPTLEQLVKTVASYKMRLYLHLKDAKMSDAGIQKVYDTLSRYEMLDKTIIISSSTKGLKRIIKANMAASFLDAPKSGDEIKRCIDFAVINKAGMIIFRYSELMTKEYISYAHKHSLRIGCYEINDTKTAGALANLGGDFLITNNNYFT